MEHETEPLRPLNDNNICKTYYNNKIVGHDGKKNILSPRCTK